MAVRWIVLLGGNELNAGFLEVAASWDARLAIVDWHEQPVLPCDRHIRLDIKAVDQVAQAVDALPGEVMLAYTSADAASETAAVLNARGGLARAPGDAIRRAGDKIAMNAAWREAGLIGKTYRACATAQDLSDFAHSLGRKLIVKPVDASSSRGVTVVDAADIAGIDWARLFTRARQAGTSALVLAEEFVDGTEYTVEMLGDDHGNVEVWGVSRKYHTANTHRNRIAIKLHYNPPDVAPDRLERIASFAAACYRALGLRNSLGHCEVIETPAGDLVPVELAARSSGFIATHLPSVLSGTPGDYLARYRHALQGGTVPSRLVPASRSSMYFFYDPPPGTWTQDGLSLASMLPACIASLAHSRTRLVEGAAFHHIDTDNERCGYEVLVGDANALTIAAVEAAERALYAQAMRPLTETLRS